MIPGFTSTGSKRPELLFGDHPGTPRRMSRSAGCRLWDEDGREYVDFIMALGAVSLGYAYPRVIDAAVAAVRQGGVGSLAPMKETELAERLVAHVPTIESVRFLKTGAEAVLAAIRIARVITGRERVVATGYHGWVDGVSLDEAVPEPVRTLRTEVPFNDVDALRSAFDGDPVAALVLEPVVDGPPTPEWLDAIRQVRSQYAPVVVLDEIKTGLRLGRGGAQARWSYPADIIVLGKALGNGFPIAAVGGSRGVMEAATRTWISSTLATEFVSLAAAVAVLEAYEQDGVERHLEMQGGRFFLGLEEIARSAPQVVEGVSGVPEFCYLRFATREAAFGVAARCAEHGLLIKHNAYNFISLAHDHDIVRESLACLAAVIEEVAWS